MLQKIGDWMGDYLQEIRDGSRGRPWIARLLLWLWLCWISFHYTFHPEFQSILDALNLGIHEFGHLVCSIFGQFVTVLGGSIVQCLIPLISFGMFHRQQDYFAFAFSGVWLGSNLHGVARYVADARAMQLDLVSPFGGSDGEIIHDWNWILSRLGWLAHDRQLATLLDVLSVLFLWSGVIWGGFLLYHMIATSRTTSSADLSHIRH